MMVLIGRLAESAVHTYIQLENNGEMLEPQTLFEQPSYSSCHHSSVCANTQAYGTANLSVEETQNFHSNGHKIIIAFSHYDQSRNKADVIEVIRLQIAVDQMLETIL